MSIEVPGRASSIDVSKRFDFYFEEAMTRPVAVERDDGASVVMMPASEYERLARLDHEALHPGELARDDLKDLRDLVVPRSAQELNHLLD